MRWYGPDALAVVRPTEVYLLGFFFAPVFSFIYFECLSLLIKAVLVLWIFYVFFFLLFAMPLNASVYMCLVVTCWERAGFLALVCGVLL